MAGTSDEHPEGGWPRALAVGVGVTALLEVLLAVVLAVAAGFTWEVALEAFLATNATMGAAFAVSGVLIAWYRPRHPLGWLLVAGGFCFATSALMAPVSALMLDAGAPEPLLRLVVTVFMFAWPWAITLFLPLVLLLFPDGHLPSPRWRWVAWAVVLTSPLFVVEMVSGPEPVSSGMPDGYLVVAAHDDLSGLWMASEIRVMLALVLGLVALVVRYRRADETVRRQLLWLLLAVLVVVVAVTPWAFVAGTPIVVLFAIPLIPLAISVAVVRHQLLDIRLVVSRAVAWLLLSLAALAAYGALVALLATLVSTALGESALPAVLVAVALAPLLPRLQREVDRWMYGDRRDPGRVAGRLGEHLAAGDERGLAGVAGALRSALRVPYAAITWDGDLLAADGEVPPHVATVPLTYASEHIGELRVGLRLGERDLGQADLATLQVVATPLAVALRALGLTQELRRSRERLVVTREEERRRLRRDLHDGLGPTLTGLALAADAATNLLDDDPEQTRELLGALRRDTRTAIGDVRRLIEGLRPPALDEVGLIGAIRQRADQLARRDDGSTFEVNLVTPGTLPALPAAVEVAAYRIATEALLNVSRHATATTATVLVECNGDLEVAVTDDGRNAVPWSPGVGLEAMRERAAEVGGHLEAGPSSSGGRVFVSIPLPAGAR